MKAFKMFARLLVVATLLLAGAAQASYVFPGSGPTQNGRLSRNGIPQDWAGGEDYPGAINPTTHYHYATYLFDVGATPYLQFITDSNSAFLEFSAYQTFYDPTNLETNWLGDQGSSGNFFNGTDTEFFQIVAAPFSTVVLVVNESTVGAGAGTIFDMLVEAYPDATFNSDPVLLVPTLAAVPEPGTDALIALPLLGLVGFGARRRRSTAT